MEKTKPDLYAGWDAREGYTKELCWRGHLVLDSNDKNVEGWFENLQDFYDWAYAPIKSMKKKTTDDMDYEAELDEIYHLVYAKQIKTNGDVKVFSDMERRNRKLKAYNKMRILFRNLNATLWDIGLYVPIKQRQDPGTAMMNMGN